MKKVLLVVAVLFSSNVAAQSADALSSSSAGINAVINGGKPTSNAASQAGASINSNIDNRSGVAVDNTNNVAGGDARNNNNVGLGVQINSAPAPAQLPMTTPGGQLPVANIFGHLGSNPGAVSIPFASAANHLCRVRYSAAYLPKPQRVEETFSKQTRLIWNPFPTEQARAGSPVTADGFDAPDLVSRVYENAACVGTITVFTKEEFGNQTDSSVVQADAMRYLMETVRGYKTLALVSVLDAMTAASGVSVEANSLSVGAVFGHIISALTTGGLGPTYSSGGGRTNPTNLPGGTYLVLAVEVDDGTGERLDVGELGRFFMKRVVQQGLPAGNGKKLEAVRQ